MDKILNILFIIEVIIIPLMILDAIFISRYELCETMFPVLIGIGVPITLVGLVLSMIYQSRKNKMSKMFKDG
jgi:hypothetical protein